MARLEKSGKTVRTQKRRKISGIKTRRKRAREQRDSINPPGTGTEKQIQDSTGEARKRNNIFKEGFASLGKGK